MLATSMSACRSGLTLAIALLAFAHAKSGVAQSPTSVDIAAILEPVYQADEPGAAVIAVRDGEVVFRKGYGMACLELEVPIRPEMAFCLASATKPFTAVAAMMLVEDGKLALDGPAARYLPDLELDEAIEVRHLLSHTSGLADFSRVEGYGFDVIHTEVDSAELAGAARQQCCGSRREAGSNTATSTTQCWPGSSRWCQASPGRSF